MAVRRQDRRKGRTLLVCGRAGSWESRHAHRFLALLARGRCAPRWRRPARRRSRARAACHLSLRAAPDTQSFAARRPQRRARAALAQETGAAFAAAASHLCAVGRRPRRPSRPLPPAAGPQCRGRRPTPNIYDDAEEQPGALIIELPSPTGRPPTQAAIEAALRCWRNPNGAGCMRKPRMCPATG